MLNLVPTTWSGCANRTRGRAILVIALALSGATNFAVADDWPQWRGPRRDGVWREDGVVKTFPASQLKPVWRAPIASGYSGPTVADGRVYVTDRLVEPRQMERVHCFDAKTGEKIWSHEYECPYRDIGYDAGPRASVTVHDGRAYALGAAGHFFCFDAAKGEIHWKKDLAEEYNVSMPIWGLAAAPLIEGDLVILQVGGEPDACLVAWNRVTGKEVWRSLPDKASYSAPLVFERQGRRILCCYTGEHVVGLDPKTGKPLWQYPFPARRMIIGVADPVLDGDHLFLTNFFDGSLMLKLNADGTAVEKVWQRTGESEKDTDGLHSIISTPILKDDHIYGVDSYGELRCLRQSDGARVWEDLTAVPKARWATIHMVRHEDHTWMFNERGELIIARLSPKGFDEISRAKLIEPTLDQLRQRDGVCWSHPAFAGRKVYIRNDKALVCADLAAD